MEEKEKQNPNRVNIFSIFLSGTFSTSSEVKSVRTKHNILIKSPKKITPQGRNRLELVMYGICSFHFKF